MDLGDLGVLNSWEILFTLIRFLLITSFIWMPLMLGAILLSLWLTYIRLDFNRKQGSTLLEIRIPQQIIRSPEAMELFLSQLWVKAGITFIDSFWKGKTVPWFSLEICSFGGNIRFFIWTQPGFRNIIESQLYAQYPNVEIAEVPDYVKDVVEEKYAFWGAYMGLTKNDAYPIKTYIDYQLQGKNMEKAEEAIDPLSNVMEYLGSLQKEESVWIQILIEANRSEGFKEWRFFNPKKEWKDLALEERKKFVEENMAYAGNDPNKEGKGFPQGLLGGSGDFLKALDRSLSKRAFNTMIRVAYMASDQKYFNKASIGGLNGIFGLFSSTQLNGFKPIWDTDNLKNPWQDFKGVRAKKFRVNFLDSYKLRSYFHPPHQFAKGNAYVLTTEELATIYHLPGRFITTPTIGRLQSKKTDPPSNLPM